MNTIKKVDRSTGEGQRILDEFIKREVYINQSYMIDELLKKEFFNYEEMENLYITNEEGEEELQEVFEWWAVTDYLADKLREENEVILENDYGTWWGRCTTGQAISIDYVIEKIYNKYLA